MLFLTTLPKDYARCFNTDCSNKNKCLRYLDRLGSNLRNNFNHQDCQHQIKAQKNDRKEKGDYICL
jgi:hypothetical protein